MSTPRDHATQPTMPPPALSLPLWAKIREGGGGAIGGGVQQGGGGNFLLEKSIKFCFGGLPAKKMLSREGGTLQRGFMYFSRLTANKHPNG